MSDVRVMGDAVPPIQAAISAQAAGIVSGLYGDTLRVADEVPGNWVVDTDPPLAVVQDDSGPTTWPVFTVATIRVTLYARGKQTAKELRRRTMGVLLAAVPVGLAHISHEGIGYTEARDTDTGADMASFTVAATVRTEVITVP